MIKIEDIKIGAIVKHISYKDNTYTITDTACHTKINNVCYHCIAYSPNYESPYTRFIRNIDDFMSNFELVKL